MSVTTLDFTGQLYASVIMSFIFPKFA